MTIINKDPLTFQQVLEKLKPVSAQIDLLTFKERLIITGAVYSYIYRYEARESMAKDLKIKDPAWSDRLAKCIGSLESMNRWELEVLLKDLPW